MIYTLAFATYIFPNQTFEIDGHRLQADTPVTPIPRFDGGVVQRGYLYPKRFSINGKAYHTDIDTLHNALNIMKKSMHNKGNPDYLKYRADRRIYCQIAPEGFDALYQKGLYQHLAEIRIGLVAPEPCAEDVNETTTNGSRTNSSSVQSLTNSGNYPTRPIFTFVAGTWAFLNDIYVINQANSLYFRYQGRLISGQTLVVDCAAGCVLLQVGVTMTDAISYIAGDLLFMLEEGANSVVIDAATLSYSIKHRSKWYI